MPTRVGVIGAGAHSARQHGPALRHCAKERPAVELAGVCDLDSARAQRYAEEFGFEAAYTDLDRMCAAEALDAVLVISPTGTTRELAGEVLAREIPTLVEKPPGRTPTETRELCAIAADHDTPNMVSFNRRFDPAVVRTREFLDGRASPRRVVARLYRVERLEAQHVFSTGIHAVDLACALLSTPERVVSHRWHSRDAGGESCEALIECVNGDAATVLLTPDAGAYEETYELVGPEYTVRIDVVESRVEAFVSGECQSVWTGGDDVPDYERAGALAETRAFLDAVETDGSFTPDLNDGLTTVRTATAVERGGRHVLSEQ